jgi:hypothetical protein
MQNTIWTDHTFINSSIDKYCSFSIPASMDILKLKKGK